MMPAMLSNFIPMIVFTVTNCSGFFTNLLFLIINSLPWITIVELTGIKMKEFIKDIKYASTWSSSKEPSGLITGRWFIGQISTVREGRDNTSTKLKLIISKKQYEQIDGTKHFDEEKKEFVETKEVQLYYREGPFWDIHYTSMPLKMKTIYPTPKQDTIVKQIVNDFHSNVSNTSVVMLYGPPGTGKSTISKFLAKNLLETKKEVSLVRTFKPTDPNDNFSTLYAKIRPSVDKPLIIVIDEIDRIWLPIHMGSIQGHKHLPTMITSKIEWNLFFDELNDGQYPGVIFIMTSNREIEYFDSQDPSYFREGRVNLKIRVN